MDNLDNFLDDILVSKETFKSNLLNLCQLFLRLRNTKLTARPSKCFIGFHKLKSLGHLVSDGRLEPNPDQLKAIADAPRPETKRQKRSFLSLIGFYRTGGRGTH